MVQRSAACKVLQIARKDRQAFFVQHNSAVLRAEQGTGVLLQSQHATMITFESRQDHT